MLNMMRRQRTRWRVGCSLLALTLIPATFTHAQSFERLVSGIPVEHNGQFLDFPFLGGLDRFLPQFVDIDGDQDFDFFIGLMIGTIAFYRNTGSPTMTATRICSSAISTATSFFMKMPEPPPPPHFVGGTTCFSIFA